MVFIILALATFAVLFGDKQNLFKRETPSPAPSANPALPALPIALSNPHVRSISVQYLVSGAIKEVKAEEDSTVLILEGNSNLPEIKIIPGVKVSRISPPYDSSPKISMRASDLKVGYTIDVYVGYNPQSGQWQTLEVYVPEDRN